ncbi:MAG: macro domain-containing protein [Clostridia bacterium]|nr:macro domain-containing protein [Clostridia bacterium]
MPFQIIRQDITKVSADAIVNTANPDPVIGGGTDSAIYMAAGKDVLLAERRKIGKIRPGDVRVTPAFGLNASYILHAVGTEWSGGDHGELQILRSCYANALKIADRLGCTSVAFPLMAAGVYGYPKGVALDIALSEIEHFLETHEMNVTLVVFDRRAFTLSESRMGEIEAYIDDNAVDGMENIEYSFDLESLHGNVSEPQISRRRRRVPQRPEADACYMPYPAMPKPKEKPALTVADDSIEMDLDAFLNTDEDTFQERLFKLIDMSGMDDVSVYKKANIDRKLFSYIRCHREYVPKKQTALAFAIALELDMNDMLDLLSRAGYTFSPSDRGDLIISYFVQHRNYNIYEINAALFKYNQKTLG